MESAPTVWHSQRLQPNQEGELLAFTRQQAGWEWMSFAVRRLTIGQNLELRAEKEEIALVLLSGRCCADWGVGDHLIGDRMSVFDGFPFALYIPPGNHAVIKAVTSCEIAECRVPSDAKLDPRLITPDHVASNLRGGENASRQIVTVIRPEFAADKLLAFEVYTPGGNWSSYPPHKHDLHNPPAEVDLDEIYYYRIKESSGYALQNLYNTELQRDTIVKARDGDAVLVRDGYHPVVAGPGYDTYYLNFLAGTSRTMAVTEDPSHVWLRDTWKHMDPRLPLVRG
jgi:5-deoxy-glucuronate isomerase